jgi:hypothetical protein
MEILLEAAILSMMAFLRSGDSFWFFIIQEPGVSGNRQMRIRGRRGVETRDIKTYSSPGDKHPDREGHIAALLQTSIVSKPSQILAELLLSSSFSLSTADVPQFSNKTLLAC